MENVTLPNFNSATLASPAANAEPKQQEVKLQQVTPAEESAKTEIELRDQEQARFDAIRQAARSALTDVFAVSDTRFTIFKDGGIFVTRFTSLRDGTVTIVPERDLISNFAKELGTVLDGVV